MDAAPSVGALDAAPFARFRERVVRASFPLAALALLAFAGVAATHVLLIQDGWMTLVDGREVARHGLPHAETLTLVPHGRPWVDQQWLAQLASYAVWTVGGVKAVLLLTAVAVVTALAVGVAAAIRGGASEPAAVAAAVLAAVAAPNAFEFRAQALAVPLFVLVFALLVEDARTPSARVLLCLPVLVLWANVHGSVVLGAGLVVLRALGRAVDRRTRTRRGRLDTAALLVGAPAAVLCTPYGTAILGYYHRVLVGGDFSHYVTEWEHTQLGPTTAAFFVVAALLAVRSGRHGGRLTRFEQVALAALALMGLEALRNIVWFAFAVLVSLPRLLAVADAERAPRRHARVFLGVAGVALVAAAAAAAGPLGRQPDRVGRTVAALTARDPELRVFADARWADWLLWTQPQLAGRTALDIRFELLTPRELRALASLTFGTPARLTRGYRLFVVDRGIDGRLATMLLGARHGRVVARDSSAEAILLPRA